MRLPSSSITKLNARQLAAAGIAAIQGGDAQIDFTGIDRCDSTAVACVLAWLRAAAAAGIHLRLLAVPADLLSLAQLYGLESVVRAG